MSSQYNTQCNFCKKKGHLARECHSCLRQQQLKPHQDVCEHGRSPQDGNHLTNSVDHDTRHCNGGNDTPVTPTLRAPQFVEYTAFQVAAKRVVSFSIDVMANGALLCLEVDTGAVLTIISEATYRRLWSENAPKLMPTHIWLHIYIGESS